MPRHSFQLICVYEDCNLFFCIVGSSLQGLEIFLIKKKCSFLAVLIIICNVNVIPLFLQLLLNAWTECLIPTAGKVVSITPGNNSS